MVRYTFFVLAPGLCYHPASEHINMGLPSFRPWLSVQAGKTTVQYFPRSGFGDVTGMACFRFIYWTLSWFRGPYDVDGDHFLLHYQTMLLQCTHVIEHSQKSIDQAFASCFELAQDDGTEFGPCVQLQ